jgi:carbonic anhydrase
MAHRNWSIGFLCLLPLVVSAQHQEGNFQIGDHQSPINISENLCSPGMHIIDLHYDKSQEHIDHREHTIELQYDPGSYLEFDGDRYEFLQFHFHTPSEHLINNMEYPLEMHMVHFSDENDHFLVLSIMFEQGSPDHFIDQFLKDVPSGVRHLDNPEKYIDINQELLPENFESFYYYEGSLTTPPYSENVSWIVDSRIHSSSESQIGLLKELEGDNHRSLQKINNRLIQKVYINTSTNSFQ